MRDKKDSIILIKVGMHGFDLPAIKVNFSRLFEFRIFWNCNFEAIHTIKTT